MADLQAKIRALQMDEAEKARRMDSLRFQIDELERAQLVPGEEESLTERRDLLRNGEKYLSALSGADYCLNGGEEGGGAVSASGRGEALAGVRTLSETWGSCTSAWNSCGVKPMTLPRSFGTSGRRSILPSELCARESRSDSHLAEKEVRRHGGGDAGLPGQVPPGAGRYGDGGRHPGLAGTAAGENGRLSWQRGGADRRRKEAAAVLEQRIQSELRDLDMHKVRFAIDFGEKEPGPDGCDAVRFLMSANTGEDLKPIARIASGGELARIMLALKNVLAEQESIGTLVFDEVDTGVSGRAAQKVAEKLAQVSRRKQVLCVTHLRQLAAMADTRYSVWKGERDGRTYTRVVLLDREQRKAELARITGGSRVTEALLASAGELLDQAERYRSELGMRNHAE